jgi:hypothetical protein
MSAALWLACACAVTPADLSGVERELRDLPASAGTCLVVGDVHRRLRAVEARLTEHLRVPPGMGVALTGVSERHFAALDDGDVLVRVFHRSSWTRLFELRVSLDGERVAREYFSFVDFQGTAPRTLDALAGRWTWPQPLDELPIFLAGVERLVDAVVARGATVAEMLPVSGNTVSTPRYAAVHYAVRPDAERARTLHASEYIVLDPDWTGAPAPWVPVGSDRVTVEAVASALARPLETTLDEGLALLDALDLPFPHIADLRDTSPNRRILNVLLPRPAGERCLTYAHLWRGPTEVAEPAEWRVTEWTGKRRELSVPLTHYVALARAAVACAEGWRASLAAFAVAPGDDDGQASTALVVTVPEGSLWHTTMGMAHVLQVSEGTPVRVVERTPLTDFDIAQPPFRSTLLATSSDGRRLDLRVHGNTCGTEYDPSPPVLFGGLAAALLGGSALRDQTGPR